LEKVEYFKAKGAMLAEKKSFWLVQLYTCLRMATIQDHFAESPIVKKGIFFRLHNMTVCYYRLKRSANFHACSLGVELRDKKGTISSSSAAP